MQVRQGSGLTIGAATVVELPVSKESVSANPSLEVIHNRTSVVGVVFQLLATVYALAMLVLTLRVYTTTKQHPGLALFFIACTASLYIICYNALAIERSLKLWLERHYPTLRQLSIAVAVVLSAIPAGVLLRLGAVGPAKTAAPVISIATAAPAIEPSKAEAAPPPKPHPAIAALASPILILTDVRYSSGPNSTMVTIDVDDAVQFEVNRLTNPDRIYLDFRGSNLNDVLSGKNFQVNDPLLRAIRVAEHDGNVTRVTLETKSFCDYLLTTVAKSHQLQLELRHPAGQS